MTNKPARERRVNMRRSKVWPGSRRMIRGRARLLKDLPRLRSAPELLETWPQGGYDPTLADQGVSMFLDKRWVVVLCILGAGSTALAQKAAGGKKTLLVLNVGPDPTDIYVDDKKRGTSDKLKELVVEPGSHIVRVVHNLDEHEDMVTLKKGPGRP